jgi:hypothetical protein
VRGEADRRASEAIEHAEAAEREAGKTDEALTRIRGDYEAGKLDVTDWTEFRDDLGERRLASLAQAEQYRAHAAELEAEAAQLDARGEVAERLAGLRAAVAGDIERADDLLALRAAIASTFESVTLYRSEAFSEGYYLDPILRREAIDETREFEDAEMTPIRPIPLSMSITKGTRTIRRTTATW